MQISTKKNFVIFASRMRNSPPESIWSLGITLWEVCSMAETPFAKIFDHQFFLTVINGALVADEEKAAKGQRPGQTYVQVKF